MCHSVNRATIDAMEHGVVSSASIMVPCPAFEEFAKYAREHPERDFGVHLTLNAEFPTHRWGPVLPAAEVPGLVDAAGNFWKDEWQTAGQARADEVERELSAQIDRASKRGVKVSHLDAHMGTVFMRPDLVEVYVNLGIKYNLPILFVRDGQLSRLFPIPRNVTDQMGALAKALDARRLPVLDRIYMHYQAESVSRKRDHYWNVFGNLPAGVSELIVHCGYDDRELGSVTSSSTLRDGDRRVLVDPATAREIARLGVTIIDWKRFQAMATSNRDAGQTVK